MRYILRITLLLIVVALVSAHPAFAERYAQCDACGLCKNTKLSQSSPIYQRPSNWESCFRCLYPKLESGGLNIPCSGITVQDLEGNSLSTQKCDTLVVKDGENELTNKPEQGRFHSDIGCISTGLNSFSSPNASVDVISRLLSITTSLTGAVGLIFFIKSTIQLLTSRGNPDSIRDAKRSLVNTLIGVVFAIFALFIFRFIATQALRIPGIG